MALRTRNMELLAKIESSYGVDPTLAAADDAVLVENVVLTHPSDIIDRNGVAGSLSPLDPKLARNHSAITFDFELKGSGTNDVPPDSGPLLQACGFVETITAVTSVAYAPTSVQASMESATLEWSLDGLVFQMLGCRGNIQFAFPVGQRPMASCAFLGKYVAPADAALPGGTYQGTVPEALKGIALSVGGYSSVLANFNVDMQNQVTIGDDLNGADGYSTVEIMDRNTQANFDPETALVATKDWWTLWQDGTPQAITATIGATAGEIITLGAPRSVLRDISYADREGRATLGIPLTLATVAGVGDDEWTLTFT